MSAFGTDEESETAPNSALHFNDTDSESQRRKSFGTLNQKDIIWLVAFAITQVALLANSAFLPMRDMDYVVCQLLFALMLAESALAAMWLSLGPGPLAVRLVVTPIWMVICAAFIGFTQRPSTAFFVLLMIGGSLSVLITFLLLLLRWLLRLKLVQGPELTDSTVFQFGTIHWFVLTLCIASLLAFTRFAADQQLIRPSNEIVILAVFGGAWGLTLVPAVLIPLWHTSSKRFIFGLILSVSLTTATATLIAFLMVRLLPQVSRPTNPVPLFLVVVPLCAWVLITCNLLMVRRAQYRLARRTE